MDVIKHYPTGPLARYVESMWYARIDCPQHLLLLPAGKLEVVIPLDREGPSDQPLMQFQRTAPTAQALGPSRTLGITFYAHGLRAFCTDALSDFSAQEAMPLRDLWPQPIDGWLEQLHQAQSVAQKFRVMESALCRALQPPRMHAERIKQAIGLLSDPFTARTVPEVAQDVGMGPRQFQQVFRENTGLTPKMYARVMRFRAAARLMRRRGSTRWTETAALCNYFDQAHLVRDFRDFSGMTPTAYLQVPGLHATCLTWMLPGNKTGAHPVVDADLVT